MALKRTLFSTTREVIDFALSNLHTSTIARVVAVNESTVDVQPVISRQVGSEEVTPPVFPDVILFTLQGGSSFIKLPINVGDSVLLVMSERSFDRWYSGDGDGLPYEYRMHDYSDAIAIGGLNPEASAIANVDTTTINGDVNMNGTLNIDGDLNVTGTITCKKLVVDGIDFATHTHTGDDGGSTSPPRR